MKCENRIFNLTTNNSVISSFLLPTIREEGYSIITLNGCFDLIHSAHMEILRFADSQKKWIGKSLVIVGLNSDSSVEKLKKSPIPRPILNQEERAKFLLSTGYVDFVVIFDELNPIAFIEAVKPKIHINDSSYGLDCIESSSVKKVGGSLILFPFINNINISSTEIIERILDGAHMNEKSKKGSQS
jgi:rfaE bifunctional protein nucleotidyltransferase chain/domain